MHGDVQHLSHEVRQVHYLDGGIIAVQVSDLAGAHADALGQVSGHVSPPSSTSSAARSRSRTSVSAAASHPPSMGGYWQNGHMVGNPPGGRQPTHPVSASSCSGTTRTRARPCRMCWSLKYSRAGPCRVDSMS